MQVFFAFFKLFLSVVALVKVYEKAHGIHFGAVCLCELADDLCVLAKQTAVETLALACDALVVLCCCFASQLYAVRGLCVGH